MSYVVGSETATAAMSIKYNPDELYWHNELPFAPGVRELYQLNFNEENSSRNSNNLDVLASGLRVYGTPDVDYKIHNPLTLLQFNAPEDWIKSSRESSYGLNSRPLNFSDTIRKICELGNLHDNWDSYGAYRINENTIERAVDFLLYIINNRNLSSINQPYVLPCPNGSIQFEWNYGRKDLEIMIPNNSQEQIVFVRDEDSNIEEGKTDHRGAILQIYWLILDDTLTR